MKYLAFFARYASNMAVSFLPAPYRKWWPHNETDDLRRAAALAGVLQGTICLGFFVVSFVNFGQDFVNGRAGDPTVGAQTINRIGDQPGEVNMATAFMGLGQYMMFSFIFQPLNLALFYFWLEGFARGIGAYTSGQVLGTTPLYLIAATHRGLKWAHYRWSLGPLILDEIHAGDGKTYDMKVLSCRPKKNWNRYMTVRFREAFFQPTHHEIGSKPRPFVHYLRKNPTGRLVLEVHDYHPEDVLKG